MAQKFQLAGAVALITGAASGIGSALADGLAGRGCRLLLVDRDAVGLDAVADRLRARGTALAVGEHRSVRPARLVMGCAHTSQRPTTLPAWIRSERTPASPRMVGWSKKSRMSRPPG